MPRPKENRTIEEITSDFIKRMNRFFEEKDNEDLATLTHQIMELKQAKSDLSKLIKKLTEKRDFKIFEESNKDKEKEKRKVKIKI